MLGKGKILFDCDFTGIFDSVVWGTASLVAPLTPEIGFVSVNEGSFASLLTSTGGVLSVVTDTGDDDNAVLIAGKFAPVEGTLTMEARYKYSSLTLAIFIGFSETMALDTPVMPAEFATATMTYNGTGGMVGIQYDVDGTTDDFRAVMADGGANTGGTASANGVRANATLTVAQWMETRVILYPDGSAEVWHGDASVVDGNNQPKLRLIKRYATGLDPANLFFATVMVENRSANTRTFDIDYMRGWASRNWKVS